MPAMSQKGLKPYAKKPEAEIYDLGDPIEYKDVPIRFTLELDGRRESVKIVEPEIDLPLPADARLLVDIGKKRWCDVVFRFDPERLRPYRLVFSTWKMVHYDNDELYMVFGDPPGHEERRPVTHRMTIAKMGHVDAWIEMSHGKARLQIRWTKGGYRLPGIPV